VDVTELQTEAAEWDAFVRTSAEGTPFHLTAWKGAVEESFGHRSHYLMAKRAGAIEGVLPLFEVSGWRGGRSLISVPYGVYGGICAATDEARLALLEAAEMLAQRRRALDPQALGPLAGEVALDPRRGVTVAIRGDAARHGRAQDRVVEDGQRAARVVGLRAHELVERDRAQRGEHGVVVAVVDGVADVEGVDVEDGGRGSAVGRALDLLGRTGAGRRAVRLLGVSVRGFGAERDREPTDWLPFPDRPGAARRSG